MTLFASFSPRVHECAGLFRLGRDIEGVTIMVELFEALMPLVASRSEEAQASCATLLGNMLACQQGQDWLGLADWLEYEWLGLLENLS